jgi:hypothetical protein
MEPKKIVLSVAQAQEIVEALDDYYSIAYDILVHPRPLQPHDQEYILGTLEATAVLMAALCDQDEDVKAAYRAHRAANSGETLS